MRTPLVIALVAVLGLLAGLGIARYLAAGDEPGVAEAPAADAGDGVAAPDLDATAAELEPLPSPGALIAVAEVTGPEDAVAGFLTAEARRDFAASYAFLAESDLDEFGSASQWTQSHGTFWPVTGFELGEVTQEGDVTTVMTLTGFASTLDPVIGLVPARADSTWTVVEQEDGWRVVVAESTHAARYPPDDTVAGVAARWAEARAACEDGAEFEVDASLVGAPVLADDLCDAGAVEIGMPTELDESDAISGLVAAYGPEVVVWARAVPLTAPVPLEVVLAPVGGQWRVMGVISSSGS